MTRLSPPSRSPSFGRLILSSRNGACIDAAFAYFICVVSQYNDALKEPEEEMMMEEDEGPTAQELEMADEMWDDTWEDE